MKPVTLKWILMQFCLASYWDSCSANKRVALIKALNSTFVAHRWEILLQIFSSVIPEVLSVAERLHCICCKPPVERYVQALRLGEGDSFTFLAWLASVHTLHEQRAICATTPGNEALELNRGIEHESVPLAPARPWIAKPPRDSVLQTSLAAYQRAKIFTHFCFLFCSYLHHSCRSLNCPVFLAFLCYWHKWWQTPGKYHKVNDQLQFVAIKQRVWPSVTVLCTIAIKPATYYVINSLAVLDMHVLDQCDTQMVSLLHFSRSPLLPYECVFAACKYSFCIHDDISTTLKCPGSYCCAVGQDFMTECENMGAKWVSRDVKKAFSPQVGM